MTKPRMIIPMLVCADAAKQIAFCQAAFGAVERSRRAGADGRVIHATLSFHESLFMVHDDMPVVHYLYCDDVDATIAKAVAAGAKVLMPAADQFWGDRVGRIMDPSHHVWNVTTRIA